MTKVITDEQNYYDIAGAIRGKLGVETLYLPSDMAAAIEAIETGTGLTSEDEGKVVIEDEGAYVLAEQTSQTITQNGTYDTTTVSELIANISGRGGGSTNILTGIKFPESSDGSNGDLYLLYAPAYIKNTIGQYVNTGYSGNSNSKYVMHFMLDSAQTSAYPTAFGARSELGSVTNASYLNTSFNNNRDVLAFAWGNAEMGPFSFGDAAMVGKFVQATLESGLFSIIVDGVKSEHSFTPSQVTDTTPIGIFAMLIGGTKPTFGVEMKDMRLFAFDIYESDVLVHSYRAALDGEDTACLYDSVENEYVYHSGGGTLQYVSQSAIIGTYLKVNGTWVPIEGQDIDDVDTGGEPQPPTPTTKGFELYRADGNGATQTQKGVLNNNYIVLYFDDNMSSYYALNGVGGIQYTVISSGAQQTLASTVEVENPESVPTYQNAVISGIVARQGSEVSEYHEDGGSYISVVGGWVGYPDGGTIYEQAAAGTTNEITMNSAHDTLLLFVGACGSLSNLDTITVNGTTYTITNIGDHYGQIGIYGAVVIENNTSTTVTVTLPASCYSYVSVIGID